MGRSWSLIQKDADKLLAGIDEEHVRSAIPVEVVHSDSV
jgi:hypothetical protein